MMEEQLVELVHRAARSEAGVSIRVSGDVLKAAALLRKVIKAMGLQALSVRRTSQPDELWIVRVIDVKR